MDIVDTETDKRETVARTPVGVLAMMTEHVVWAEQIRILRIGDFRRTIGTGIVLLAPAGAGKPKRQ